MKDDSTKDVKKQIESTGESSATEVTTENTTEKQIDTGWQTIDGELRYVRNDGKDIQG